MKLKYDFNRPKSDYKEISDIIIEAMRKENKVEELTKVIKELRQKYKPRCKKANKCISFKDKVILYRTGL